MVLKLTWKFSLFARNQKILPSNVLFLFGISCLEIQNFRSYKQHRKGFRISDPQRIQRRILNFWSSKNTTKDSEFLTPKIPQERIQYFWYPKDSEFLIPYNDTQKDSEFLIPYKDTKVFRISDPPKNTYRRRFRISDLPRNIGRERIQNFSSPIEQDSQHFIPKEHSLEWNRNSWSPKQLKWKKIFFSLGSKQSQNLR